MPFDNEEIHPATKDILQKSKYSGSKHRSFDK